MDVKEAINARRSIRAFKPDPVPRSALEEILGAAIRAPSWGNTQPWDFYIVAGDKLEEIRQGFAGQAGQPPSLEIPRPQGLPEPYASRRRAVAVRTTETPVPMADSPEARRLRVPRMFGAPCVIYICTGRDFYFQGNSINAWAIFDCGLAAENIMLAALDYGLGTVPLAQAVVYPDVVRRVLQIPDSQIIVLGIAIGYPDWNDPVNQRQSVREPLASVARWIGF